MKSAIVLFTLLFHLSARAGTWSCYFDTARITTPTPSGVQVQMNIYNASDMPAGSINGYFYLQGAQMVGFFNGTTASPGTYTGVITGSNGTQYRTNPFTLTDAGNGWFNGPGWIHGGGEAFPNVFDPATYETLDGNHIITGTLDVDGNRLTLGTHPNYPTEPGFAWDYVPVSGSAMASLTSSTHLANGSWLWKAGPSTLMTLTQSGLILNVPIQASGFNIGNSVVLTQPSTVPSMTLRLAGATAASSKGIAIGEGAKVQFGDGTGSVAIGSYSETNGNSGTAVGRSARAFGNYASAFGVNSYANGTGNVAVGYQSTSYGNSSTSVGVSTLAAGWQSTSMGNGTAAYGANQTVIGRFNVPAPTVAETNTVNFQDSSVTFVIGNGYQLTDTSIVRQNVLTIRRDNGAALGASVTSGKGGQVVVGRYNEARANGAFIVGAGEGGAPLNALRAKDDGTILIRRQGDLPMDGFDAGEQP